jgi:hypothetical protein
MRLNSFAAEKRKALFEQLSSGHEPSEGQFDLDVLKEGRAKGQVQMGSTRYEPHSIIFEFIFPDPHGVATVLAVRLTAPERIVFMPVPDWVVQAIWQGEVSGSYEFETDAMKLLDEFRRSLEPGVNDAVAREPAPIGRA